MSIGKMNSSFLVNIIISLVIINTCDCALMSR